MALNRFSRFCVWTTLAAFTSTNAFGGPVDIANVPLVSMSTKVVRPNVMFILDDSSSMLREYMPDSSSASGSLCYRNFGYNKIYYNPAITYDLPKQSNGNDYAYVPAITSARNDGYNSAEGSTNLAATTTTTTYSYGTNVALTSTSFTTTNGSSTVTVTRSNHGLSTGAVVRFTGSTSGNLRGISWSNIIWTSGNNLAFTITRTGANTFTFVASSNATSAGTGGQSSGSNYSTVTSTTTTTGNYYYTTHTTNPATCDSNANYTRVNIVDRPAAEQQNFANWYSFYRTRLLMMKTAVGRAFVGVDDNFRVGFTTINETGTNSSRFLGVQRFTAANKSTWYSQLYNLADPAGTQYTPLRGALSKAGRYYSGTLTGARDAADPVQYSCQKNFAILTTDGYWNTTSDSTSTYGARNWDNSALVGNQDGDLATSPRPMYDAAGSSNSLADVARYYYRTDLRSPTTGPALGGTRDDGTRTNVRANAQDSNGNDLPDGHQHMKTITLGLGLDGELSFPGALPGLTAGTVNWPDPLTTNSNANGFPSRLDDLWHAAINGGGVHLSAADADEVVEALRAALATIVDQDRSGASAATSSLEPIAGDNFAYVAEYTTSRWHGDLEARTIDLGTGAISTASQWSAQALLDGTVSANTDSRNIYTWNGTSRVNFTLANVNASHFNANQLSQYGSWNSTQRTNASAGALLNFLRGQHQFEARTDATHTDANNRLFRQRDHVLGDIVDSSPVYVKKPPFRYTDAGYAGYVGTNTNRGGTVYVGSNDGMLHAFNAETGAERWAYVPRILHPELHRLADANYAANHRFYVNGSITVGDAFVNGAWRTILVAGLGGGGKGYFALDVTNPDNPTVLWEFTNPNLGFTFGNPVLTKRAVDGSWVVLFGSGYNNSTGGGDSQGRLFMVDAYAGTVVGSIPTTAGNDPDRSGLAKITNWVLDTLVDNTTQYVYGGDLAGNLWRFDINALTAQRMGQTSATPGALPITARPEVARIRDTAGTYHRVVFVGTGRYLGGGDVSGGSAAEVNQQILLAVKDTGTDLGVLTSNGAQLVAQTLNAAATPRTIPSPQPVNWISQNGWYVNIPVGERVTIEPRLQLGTVSFVANSPVDDYCAMGGSSWLYALDYRTGGAISTQASNLVGFLVDGQTIGTGLTIIRLPDGRLIAIVNTPTGTQTIVLPTEAAGAGTVRRVGYREIN